MKKKLYEKPSVEVVKLQASVAMLTGSPENSTTGTQNYYVNEEVTE